MITKRFSNSTLFPSKFTQANGFTMHWYCFHFYYQSLTIHLTQVMKKEAAVFYQARPASNIKCDHALLRGPNKPSKQEKCWNILEQYRCAYYHTT